MLYVISVVLSQVDFLELLKEITLASIESAHIFFFIRHAEIFTISWRKYEEE